MPTARPLAFRLHATVPEPVPLDVVSVVHAFFFVALHAVDAALVPLSVTVALSLGALFPCVTATLRETGASVSVNGDPLPPDSELDARTKPHPVLLSKPGVAISRAPFCSS